MRTDRTLEYGGIRLDVHFQTTDPHRHSQLKSMTTVHQLFDRLLVALTHWTDALDEPVKPPSRKYSGEES